MLRPYICELGFLANGTQKRSNPKLEKLKSLIEAFHNFCLLQDDCMDNANTRHNTETTHLLYQKILKTDSETAKWVALTVSDLVFFQILKEFYENKFYEIPKVSETFNKMIVTVTEGQAQDLAMRRKIKTPLENILKKTLMKTADYSIASPFALGFFASGEKKLPVNFDKFSNAFGMAYQIQDDLMDYDLSASSDKDRFLDFSSGTPSFVSFYLYWHAEAKEKRLMDETFGKVGLEEARTIVTGLKVLDKALEASREEYKKNYEEAVRYLKKLKISNTTAEGFEILVNKLLERKS